MVRKNVNTTIDNDLWQRIKILSIELSAKGSHVGANDLLEEGMTYIIEKYTKNTDSGKV